MVTSKDGHTVECIWGPQPDTKEHLFFFPFALKFSVIFFPFFPSVLWALIVLTGTSYHLIISFLKMYFMYVAWTKLQLHMDRDKVLHIFPSEAQHWITHPPSTQDPQSSVTCGKVLVWCGLVCCFSPLPFISNLSFSLVYLIHSYSIFHTFIYMYSQPWKTGGIVLCMLGIWSISFCAFFFI